MRLRTLGLLAAGVGAAAGAAVWYRRRTDASPVQLGFVDGSESFVVAADPAAAALVGLAADVRRAFQGGS